MVINKTSLISFIKTDIFIIILLFIITFGIYVHNISPSVFGGDSGDFLSAILTNGVPHPSGYPLYTIIGILFNKLPLGNTTAWRIGLSSAFFASLAVIFVYLTSLELTKKRIIAAISSLTLAFLYPFWIYAEVAEVFSLHCFFILLIVFLILKYIRLKKDKYLLFLAFFLGLSLTNNLTILLLFPAVGLSILATDIKILKNYKLIFKCIFLFILGLLPYIYIPIAASKNPIVNWDRAVNLRNFIDLILRKDYGWINKSIDQPLIRGSLKGFLVYWSEFLPILIPILGTVGAVAMIIKKKYQQFFLLFLCFLTVGPAFIIYTSTPTDSISVLAALERFYIPPIIFLILFTSVGIDSILTITKRVIKLKNLQLLLSYSILIIFFVLPASQYLQNFRKTDLSEIQIGDNLGYDIVNPLGKGSFLFVSNDEYGFNTLYVQLENQFRTDVTIPGKNAGFEKFLTLSNVTLTEEVESYLIKRHNTVEQGDLYSGIVYLMDQGIDVYSTLPKVIIENQSGKFVTIPYGLVYKFVKAGSPLPNKEAYLKEQEEIWGGFHLSEFELYKDTVDYSLTLSTIKSHYAQGYFRIANFIKLYYKDEALYNKFYEKAVNMDPVTSFIRD